MTVSARSGLFDTARGVAQNVYVNMAVGGIARLLLVAYGFWQDETMTVRYTDVDYDVFTDAAKHVIQGRSPYDRQTYRYTPLLAYVLTPNIVLTPIFGKLLFIIFDVFAGYLIYAILVQRNYNVKTAGLCSSLWLLNPITMTVSSRGNAESIMALLVLAVIYCLNHRSNFVIFHGFVLYGLSVHIKIYPVIYSLAIYLMLNDAYNKRSSPWWRLFGMDILPNRTRISYILISLLTFGLLTGGFFHLYGEKFLQETYLYHITRKDTRHNFSVYFYMLYLLAESEWSQIAGLASFIPQALLILVTSIKYYHNLPLCCFLQTYIFVTFNKVCTSQYFLWYLCLLPLVIPDLRISGRKSVLLLGLWFVGQALWLSPAYYLEFEGRNTFHLLWMAGITFFVINIYLMTVVISSYGTNIPQQQRKDSGPQPSPLARKPIRFNNKKYD